MTWLLIGALVWIALALPAALVIGRAIRIADAHRDAELAARAPRGRAGTPAHRRRIVRDPVRPSERAPRAKETGIR